MTAAVVRTWLRVADPTALTAREALRAMRVPGGRIEDVARSWIWTFAWSEPAEARPLLERLARETNLLVNPNKHAWTIATGEASLPPRGDAWVLVHQDGEGEELGETLKRRRVPGFPPAATRRGTLWELRIAGSEAERREALESVAVARSREAGLFANPEIDAAHLFLSPPGAQELIGALASA